LDALSTLRAVDPVVTAGLAVGDAHSRALERGREAFSPDLPCEAGAVIYHLAELSHWEQAQRDGAYTRSTIGRSLDDEGFVHAASAEQWPGVRSRFYAAVTEPLVLLHIDESRLTSPLVLEVGDPETGEQFPHVYGRIDLAAVVGTTLLQPPHA
jgi:uncharacterized protein (DUF952 family)